MKYRNIVVKIVIVMVCVLFFSTRAQAKGVSIIEEKLGNTHHISKLYKTVEKALKNKKKIDPRCSRQSYAFIFDTKSVKSVKIISGKGAKKLKTQRTKKTTVATKVLNCEKTFLFEVKYSNKKIRFFAVRLDW